MKSKKGFTLIELLVVIAIIGILSAIVLSSLSQTRLKARDSRRIQDLKQIVNALELYRAQNEHYPMCTSNYNAIHGGGCSYGGWTISNDTTSWNSLANSLKTYIAQLPTDPVNDTTRDTWNPGGYSYAYTSGYSSENCKDGSCYDLIAQFEDPNNPLRCEIKSSLRRGSGINWTCDDLPFSKKLYIPEHP